jgi:transposase-like protein
MDAKDFFESEFFKKEVLDKLSDPKDFDLFLSELYKRGVESMLKGEIEAHLGYSKHEQRTGSENYRNGYQKKNIKTEHGSINIEVPRDRNGSFEPVVVPKRSRLSQGIENLIISLYAKGMSNSDIEDELQEIYGFSVSTSTISLITDKINEDILVWQNRPLEPIYFVVWLDAIVFKVRENSKVINKAVYLAVGLRADGNKEVLGMWLGKNESAAFWMSVLTDLRARGVQDILITVSDNLNGFSQTIKSVFPKSNAQICVVHQIRNATKYVVWKDRKNFTKDMKNIYTAPNQEAAKAAFNDFKKNWYHKYSYAVDSWERNWQELTTFLEFPV